MFKVDLTNALTDALEDSPQALGVPDIDVIVPNAMLAAVHLLSSTVLMPCNLRPTLSWHPESA